MLKTVDLVPETQPAFFDSAQAVTLKRKHVSYNQRAEVPSPRCHLAFILSTVFNFHFPSQKGLYF